LAAELTAKLKKHVKKATEKIQITNFKIVLRFRFLSKNNIPTPFRQKSQTADPTPLGVRFKLHSTL